ncbi:IPT/TIG domain-containing protein [Kitasatospora sp. NPDC093679]|uniref:IPT/TIG domain-containing protein n=1 Tax=Kitasatospora sp. NPDC093679 TaxID=3154983 RepID=UPI003443AF24
MGTSKDPHPSSGHADETSPTPSIAVLLTASPPALSSLTPGQGPAAGGTIVTLTGSNLTGASAVTFGSTAATSFTVVSATQITATAPPGPAGPVQVTVTTSGGTSNGLAFFLLNAPALTAVTPSQGPGGSVVLTGTNLLAASGVSFGGTPAVSFSVISSTQISALAPVGSGTVAITVTTPGGTSNGVPFTYVPSPSLSAVTPLQGPTAGGAQVTLTGTNLTSVTAVAFGTSPATSFSAVSATQITAVAPPGTAGPVQVSVTSPGGTSGGLAYFFLNAPTLTSVAPSQGPTAAGTAVTLVGTNLTNATAVTFGSTAATSFTVVSATQINATAPAGTGTVNVTATTPGGTSNGQPYTYLAAPTLTSINPVQGPLAGGITVTLVGTNLTNATAVTFGSTAATSFTVVSATQVNAVAPAGSAGPVQVTVTTPGGTSNGLTHTRIQPPAI